MKKINPFLLLILLTCLALPFGCKKDEETKVDKTVQLAGTSSKKWKLTAATATVAVLNISIDIFKSNDYYTLPICKQDDIFTFSADNTYKTEEGASNCGTATTDKGTWAFNADKTQITLTSTGAAALPYSGIPLTINFAGNTFKGEATNVTIPNVPLPVNISFTFTAQ